MKFITLIVLSLAFQLFAIDGDSLRRSFEEQPTLQYTDEFNDVVTKDVLPSLEANMSSIQQATVNAAKDLAKAQGLEEFPAQLSVKAWQNKNGSFNTIYGTAGTFNNSITFARVYDNPSGLGRCHEGIQLNYVGTFQKARNKTAFEGYLQEVNIKTVGGCPRGGSISSGRRGD